ncbi:MAG: OmpA family protein [Flavobacteriales bacterium]|nr:OmpA family protein [Flavobacteriales bacterium]
MKWLLFIAFLIPFCSIAQEDEWKVKRCEGINTSRSEILVTMMGENVVIAQRSKIGFINDVSLPDTSYTLFMAQRGSTYDSLEMVEMLPFSIGRYDDGSAFFHPGDAALWISSANNYRKGSLGTLKIYRYFWYGDSWSKPRPFDFNNPDYHMTHPWMDMDNKRIFFSSDMPGGQGGMDIWFCNMLANGSWSDPIPMPGINTEGNEIFPTYFNDALYFSSDREGGQLDIYRSARITQWESCEKLPEPWNSPKDDLQLVMIDEFKGFITSSRQGALGSDDIFIIQREVPVTEEEKIIGLLECMGQPLRDIQVQMWNERNEIILNVKTDTLGRFDLAQMDPMKNYRVKVTGLPPQVVQKSYVHFLDSQFNRIRSFKLNIDGTFEFQFLPSDQLVSIEKLSNQDRSVLHIPLDGQVFQYTPGDIGENEAVYVLDDDGELLAVSYTSQNGRFHIPELRPLSAYTFKMKEDGRDLNLIITDGQNETVIPVNDGEAHYQRLNDDELVRIVDENNKPIFIRDDEVFIIRDIYYRFDSINLNPFAKDQLTQLSRILSANPQISIELSSHTDSRGRAEYNQALSEKRASSARNFLIAIGVDPKRIEAFGFGESKLTNHCSDDVECSEQEHALNRRSEIKIKVNPAR